MATAAPVMLVPVEYSDLSRPLVRLAAAQARKLGLRLELLHVWSPAESEALPAEGDNYTPESLRRLAAEERRPWLDALLPAEACTGLEVVRRVEVGEVVPTLLARAAAPDVELLVMATHGRTGLQRLLHGSVTEALVARSPRPVLVCRPETGDRLVFAQR